MISEKYRCIFVHVPKTAGQSIEQFFLALHGLDWKSRAPLLLRYNPNPDRGPERLAHLFASEYVACEHIDQEQFSSYFKFGFVRNPWARMVSLYRSICVARMVESGQACRLSFSDYVLRVLPAELCNSTLYRNAACQSDFLYDSSGDLLVDFVGRFENLQQDFNAVCSRLHIENSSLEHINSSGSIYSHSDVRESLPESKNRPQHIEYYYTDYYNDETAEAVGQMYARDVRSFDYRFGE